ncbi:5-dehydro-2-deoxygluconokinase [Streptomyces sp. RB5]|uniref:5-dehydro-2-deoxygluconokinase n=1 Tax=Streptomyces smaragdinus TaxID=2585196 RepID=A0A7K0CMS1_9ACTN|nr:5-dehydro-2-deoxygluconokinase [Streptomyces smaragdinus]MQY14778.1 5-dehydro-2-deoxygluconokinase [Streptomyces smaragdinus]
MGLDVLTMGRVGVDIYPRQSGVPLADVTTFAKYLGGSPTNVAVAAARYGRAAAVITKTGADPFGTFVRSALTGYGVDTAHVGVSKGLPTPVTFCEIFPPDDFPLYFYRFPKAPDLDISVGELDLDAIGSAAVFWMTGTGLCEEPSRSATLAALRARARRPHTVFDLDWRPVFWDAPPQPWYEEALKYATVAVGNVEECEVATGTRDPYEAARRLLAADVELAVVKQGPRGVLAVHRDGTTVEQPPVPVEVVNGLGAGDAFGGALVHGLLAGWDLDRTMAFAAAAGAHVAARLACSDAMPTEAEVEKLRAAR